jgi:hypothetical protein
METKSNVINIDGKEYNQEDLDGTEGVIEVVVGRL